MKRYLPIIAVLLVLAILIGVVGILVWNNQSVRETAAVEVPYQIEAEMLDAEYAKQFEALGPYVRLRSFPALEAADGSVAVFFSKDGESHQQDQMAFLAISQDTTELSGVIESAHKQSCTEEEQISRQVNDTITYYQGYCDNHHYYIYKQDQWWILFDSTDSAADLKSFISDYIN